MQNKPDEQMLRPKESAPYIGVSVRTLADYAASGKIPYYKLSTRCTVFKKSDLDAFLESRRVGQ